MMEEPAIPASSANEPSITELLDAALPFDGLDDLLWRLSAVWQLTFSPAAGVIAVLDVPERTMHRIRLGADAETLPAPTDALEQSLRDWLPADSGSATTWTPLAASGRVFAGVLLSFADESARRICPSPWATAAARLLDQARRDEHRFLSAKLESLAEFAAGAGHEINNPLASIILSAQSMARDETDRERLRLLGVIGGQAYRVRDMIGDTMLFARPPEPKPERVDLSQAVSEVAEKFAEQARERSVHIDVDCPNEVAINADPVQLAIVISELLRNSLHAVTDGGRIQLQTRIAPRTGDAELVVSDDGSGLSDIDRRHLFDPFYSGRQAGRGLGFGLPKAWRIATNHGGWIAVDEQAESGVTIVVRWPAG